jgi:hypothetical protein
MLQTLVGAGDTLRDARGSSGKVVEFSMLCFPVLRIQVREDRERGPELEALQDN